MTVRELIQELLKHDMDMIVAYSDDDECGYVNVDTVEIVRTDGWKDKVVLS